MTVRGIPYQYTHPKDIFLGKYIALDGTERERWIHIHPDSDAFTGARNSLNGFCVDMRLVGISA